LSITDAAGAGTVHSGIPHREEPAMSRKESKSPTFDRIVEASLQLFNQQGERSVTTNHIARYLNISTGNLYYHFACKEDIINELYRRYSKGMADYLNAAGELSVTASVEGLVSLLEKVLRHLWTFRFIPQSISSLFSVNQSLQESYSKIEAGLISRGVEKLFFKLRDQGMLEGDDVQIGFLARNFQLLQTGWIARPDIAKCPQEAQTVAREGCLSLLYFLAPYVSSRFRQPFERVLAGMAPGMVPACNLVLPFCRCMASADWPFVILPEFS
jgi:AcrR family transcriptional regulator